MKNRAAPLSIARSSWVRLSSSGLRKIGLEIVNRIHYEGCYSKIIKLASGLMDGIGESLAEYEVGQCVDIRSACLLRTARLESWGLLAAVGPRNMSM